MNTDGCGQLFWVTGLAGAGKSSIAQELHALIRRVKANVVSLDGDALREVFGATTKHTQPERLLLALQYGRLCRLLTEQGIDVVCATISMFHECRAWNRGHIPNYREIYVRVPMDILVQRDQKQLYSRAHRGEVRDVMGVDIRVEEPTNPDMVLDNDGRRRPFELAQDVFVRYYADARDVPWSSAP